MCGGQPPIFARGKRCTSAGLCRAASASDICCCRDFSQCEAVSWNIPVDGQANMVANDINESCDSAELIHAGLPEWRTRVKIQQWQRFLTILTRGSRLTQPKMSKILNNIDLWFKTDPAYNG